MEDEKLNSHSSIKISSIKVKNKIKEVQTVIEHFEGFGMENNLPFAAIQKFNIVLDELLNNIISYGFKDKNEHDIEVDIELRNLRLTITIIDDGIPFNPTSYSQPDTMLSMEDRNFGGLGIHLVKNLVDEFDYKRNTNRNIITLVKYNINKK